MFDITLLSIKSLYYIYFLKLFVKDVIFMSKRRFKIPTEF